MRAAVAGLALVACQWVDDGKEAERLDQDGDGYPFAVDCNDDDPQLSGIEFPEGLAHTLSCDDEEVGPIDVEDGSDLLQFVQCQHPTLPEDLVVLREWEYVFRFLSPVATPVRITLRADDLIAAPVAGGPLALRPDEDNGDIALIANRGSRCAVDRCAVALPPLGDWKSNGTKDEGSALESSLEFFAEGGEPWAVAVSGDSGQFALSVVCGG